MWLLSTARAELHFFPNPEDVPQPGFCILSHTWGKNEQTFQDVQRIGQECVQKGRNAREVVSEKIRKCCELAEKDGFGWVWNDTCCIDKTSSAELSEAINSMFRYYSLSALCYAYLDDVRAEEPKVFSHKEFRASRWHTRGWTLQELIASKIVILLSSTWTFLGTKEELAGLLERATKIPVSLLRGEAELSSFSIAQRMSWAALRKTSRKEDEAYCLLGIFSIYLPTLYGEGSAAFSRLQEEIIRKYADTTIFAWRLRYCNPFRVKHASIANRSSLLACSPQDFASSRDICYDRGRCQEDSVKTESHVVVKPRTAFTFTPHGVLAHVPLAIIHGITLIDLSWQIIEEGTSRRRHAYLILTLSSECKNEDSSLWYVSGYAGSQSRSTALLSDEKMATWKMQDVYISIRNDMEQLRLTKAPSQLRPIGQSYSQPFFFRLSSSNITIENDPNAGIHGGVRGDRAARMIGRRSTGDTFCIYLAYGECATPTCPGSSDQAKLARHWVVIIGPDKRWSPSQHIPHFPVHHLQNSGGHKDFPLDSSIRSLPTRIRLLHRVNVRVHYLPNQWSTGSFVITRVEFTETILPENPRVQAINPESNLILLHTDNSFPVNDAGPAIMTHRKNSIYLGTAVLTEGGATYPCRIVVQSGAAKVFVLYNHDSEIRHYGYYYLLVFDEQRMHWVSSSQESTPICRRHLIIGGRNEKGGYNLYHAGSCNKQGEGFQSLGYLEGSNKIAQVMRNGRKRRVDDFYLLSWKQNL